MTEPSSMRDEANLFLSIYDKLGASDSVTTDLEEQMIVNFASNDNSNLGNSKDPEIESTPLPVVDQSSISDLRSDTKSERSLSETQLHSPDATSESNEAYSNTSELDPNLLSDNYVNSKPPKTRVQRSLLRWILSGSIAGIAVGFIQGNFEIVHRDPISAVVATPQMLSNPMASDSVIKELTLKELETVPADVSSLINDALINARRYFDQTSTYTGWRPATPILGASGGPYLVLAVVINGACYVTGIVPGYDNTTELDPTGNRCETNSINDLQEKLNSIG